MSDLNVPRASLLIARGRLAIEEQELVLAKKDLRVAEIGEEEDRVKAEQGAAEERAKAHDKEAKAASGIEAQRLTIKASEQRLAVTRLGVRLLELDDERRQIDEDVEASRTHIATLQTEISQQQARLKDEQEATRG